mgnify:CR=1 FL=1
MKNTIICSIAVLSAALLAACTETTRIWPEEGESKAYVEVSSQKVIFDADGGNAVITVATNADGWDYAAEGDWFTVARQDGNALLVETLINAGAETLTGKLTVSAEKNGETVSQEVALVQRAERKARPTATSPGPAASTNSTHRSRATAAATESATTSPTTDSPSRTAPSPNCSGNRATTATRPCRAKSSTARRSTGAAT